MTHKLARGEVFGFIRPAVDVHTLGISYVENLLADQNCQTVIADAAVCEAANNPSTIDASSRVINWIRTHRITRIGFSYRLDPLDGVERFERLLYQLSARRLLSEEGGPIRAVYFAGLPAACREIERRFARRVVVFYGDETPRETLEKLGIPLSQIQGNIAEESEYDEIRAEFARDLLRRERHVGVRPPNRAGYPGFGTPSDHLVARVRHAQASGGLPLMRAHVGPFGPDREAAVALYLNWVKELARTGYLDILSVGTSQLSQSHFEMRWDGMANGGGVPIQNRAEFAAIWEAARPMLVRTYAGTRNVPKLAEIYEASINNAWTALSFWWFCRIDGRGPNDVLTNLREHFATLRLLASWNKPLEPNIPHHFAFRGADDLTYVLSAVLAAKAAQLCGVPYLILQLMLNTPRFTWGVQDLAKSRAIIHLVREYCGENFPVFIQPRAGLDYFSFDLEKAKAQLASVSALMDDIEPENPNSPAIVHVVSYSEGSHLATPDVVDESVRITAAAIAEYRALKKQRKVPDMSRSEEVESRMQAIVSDARQLIFDMERTIEGLYSPEGFYRAFAEGYLIAPYLWEGREEFRRAVDWRTRVLKGAVRAVDEHGNALSAMARIDRIAEWRAQASGSNLTQGS